MKKSKLLLPLMTITTIGTIAPVLASCSCGGGNTPTSMITITINPSNGSAPYTKQIKSGTKWSEIKSEIATPTWIGVENKEFDFWTIDGEKAIEDDYKFETATQINAIYYDAATISFSSTTGGTISSSASIKVRVGTTFAQLTLPTTQAEPNYYFCGWYYNDSEISLLDPITSNMNIVATFKNNEEILSLTGSTISHLNYCPHGEYTVPTKVGETDITGIGRSAFYGCVYLTKVNIGSNITTIDSTYNPFTGCISLQSINITGSDKYYSVHKDTGAALNCIIEKYDVENATTKYKLIAGCNSSIIPEYITSISSYAFAGISGITNVTVPATCESVGQGAFALCEGLTTASFASDTTTIDTELFYGCKSLIAASLPKNITQLPSQTFWGCSALKSFDLRQYTQLTQIGYYAFTGCSSLESIYIAKSVNTISGSSSGNPFSGCTNLNTIVVEDGSTSFSSNNCNCIMNASATEIITGCANTTIADTVTSIGGYAFYGVEKLQSINLNNVTKIGNNAFDSTGLTSITLPSTLTEIGSNVFKGTKLTSVDLPANSSIIIPSGCFANIETLKQINVPAEITKISTTAFTGCNNITSIDVKEGNTHYSSKDSNENNLNILYAISNNGSYYGNSGELMLGSNNSSIIIPKEVTEILDSAFANMKNITNVATETTDTNPLLSIGTSAFQGCESLQTVSLKAKFDSYNTFSIGASAFKNCKKLTSATFELTPGTYDKISYGESSFENCESLTSVFNSNVKRVIINKSAFASCKALTSIDFEEMSYYTILDKAFNYCTGLKDVKLLHKDSVSSTTSIAQEAFGYCSNITSLAFDSYKIEDNAFAGCYALNEVDYEYTLSSWPSTLSKNAFPNPLTTSNGKFTVINRTTKNLIKENWSCFYSWTYLV